MPYQEDLKKVITRAPKTLSNQLGRWAVHHDFSVLRISKATGATRQTVYNWLGGGQVTQAYRDKVKMLLEVLRSSPNGEQAWRRACQTFSIKA